MDVVLASDEWCIMRLAELRSRGERAEIRIVVENGRIMDTYILRRNGTEERRQERER